MKASWCAAVLCIAVVGAFQSEDLVAPLDDVLSLVEVEKGHSGHKSTGPHLTQAEKDGIMPGVESATEVDEDTQMKAMNQESVMQYIEASSSGHYSPPGKSHKKHNKKHQKKDNALGEAAQGPTADATKALEKTEATVEGAVSDTRGVKDQIADIVGPTAAKTPTADKKSQDNAASAPSASEQKEAEREVSKEVEDQEKKAKDALSAVTAAAGIKDDTQKAKSDDKGTEKQAKSDDKKADDAKQAKSDDKKQAKSDDTKKADSKDDAKQTKSDKGADPWKADPWGDKKDGAKQANSDDKKADSKDDTKTASAKDSSKPTETAAPAAPAAAKDSKADDSKKVAPAAPAAPAAAKDAKASDSKGGFGGERRANAEADAKKAGKQGKSEDKNTDKKQDAGNKKAGTSNDLGESDEVAVGMGDSIMENSIVDGTALDNFHTGHDALKFAYAHDSVEQKKALASQMKEQPAAFQEGGMRDTMNYFQGLKQDRDFMDEYPVQAAIHELSDIDSILN